MLIGNLGKDPEARSTSTGARVVSFSTACSRLLGDQEGVTAIEYALVASIIALAVVPLLGTICTSLKTRFNNLASESTPTLASLIVMPAQAGIQGNRQGTRGSGPPRSRGDGLKCQRHTTSYL